MCTRHEQFILPLANRNSKILISKSRRLCIQFCEAGILPAERRLRQHLERERDAWASFACCLCCLCHNFCISLHAGISKLWWHLAFRKNIAFGSQELLAFTRDLDTELVKARLDLTCSLVQFDAFFLSPLFRWERMCQVKEECYNTVQAIKKKAAEALKCTCWHNSGPETRTDSVLPFMSSSLLWPLVQDLEYFRTTELAKAKADFKREVRWSWRWFWGLWAPEDALTCLHQKRFVLLTMWQVEEVQRQRDMLRKEVEVCRIAVSTFCEFWHWTLTELANYIYFSFWFQGRRRFGSSLAHLEPAGRCRPGKRHPDKWI